MKADDTYPAKARAAKPTADTEASATIAREQAIAQPVDAKCADTGRDVDVDKTDEVDAGCHSGSCIPNGDAIEAKRATTRSSQSSEIVGEPTLTSQPAPTSARRAYNAQEYRRRLVNSRNGPDRPLAVLAAREAELDLMPTYLAALSNYNEGCPDPNLLTHQLARSVDTSFVSQTRAQVLRREAISLYAALGSRDPIESMLHCSIVMANNAAANCYGRLAITSDPRARDINLRGGVQATNAFRDLVKLRDARRGQGQEHFSIGKVNIESGGQAIVGKVEVFNHPDTPSEPKPKSTDGPPPEDET